MTTVALFHSVLGLRKVEQLACERMRAAGHIVVAPDLYDGMTAQSVDEGFDLMTKIGWNTICGRATEALALIPENAVLAGHSMGAGVVSKIWPDRMRASGIILLHGLAEIPHNVRRGIPASVHVADPDLFAPPGDVANWSNLAQKAGIRAEVFKYPNAGHFYTDEALPDYDPISSQRTWARVLEFLASIEAGRSGT
ncbi:dienelactone hydrolase family protein [Mesorhizobium sp.]|nr:dienelactone hydrolase family protein [Mesorhizobium sp.]RWA67065.1 MAG: dienelactone hydrolase family protein [Mesorhizobium sp.]RWA79043.1 MAG: dienelactone hydrolase family protein [Mesorhizobium sp.]